MRSDSDDPPEAWKRLQGALTAEVTERNARSVFVVDQDGDVLLAAGSFDTQIVYPPAIELLEAGPVQVRSKSGELLVFRSLGNNRLLVGVFGAGCADARASECLERIVKHAIEPH